MHQHNCTKKYLIFSMMGEGFEHRAAGFLLKKELNYFSKVSSTHFSTKK